LAGEILVFGRIASGERLSRGLVREAWSVRRDDRLIWADALHLDGDLKDIFAEPACFGGATAQAIAVYVDDDPAAYLDLARSLLDEEDDGLRSATTAVNGVLVTRWLGHDPARLRRPGDHIDILVGASLAGGRPRPSMHRDHPGSS
jgi:urease accessory protein